MSQHYAITNSRNLGKGVAFSVQSGALRRLDVLNLHIAEDGQIDAMIERFDPSGLFIRLNSLIYKCRPWRMGDAAIRRLPGTVSNWTVEQVREMAEEPAHA